MMHQRISKKIFIYLFIFFILVTVNNTKLSFDFYKIKTFDINGLNHNETQKLQNDMDDYKNLNIFSFDKNDLLKIIYSNKVVEELNITKIYPSKIKIQIKKTKFLAFTKKNGVDYIVLGNGNLIEKKEKNLKLPFIFGDIDIKKFLEFKKLIDVSNFKFSEIENLYYFKSNRWDLLTRNGLILKMPSDLNVKKLNLFFDLIKKNDFKNAKIIDLRQNNLMIVNE